VTSTSNGWDQHKSIAILDRRVHPLQIFDVVLTNEKIDKWTQFTTFVEQVRFDGGILCGQIRERIRNI
jgi:hypothetical protein